MMMMMKMHTSDVKTGWKRGEGKARVRTRLLAVAAARSPPPPPTPQTGPKWEESTLINQWNTMANALHYRMGGRTARSLKPRRAWACG